MLDHKPISSLALIQVYSQPGIHMMELQRLLGISFSSTRYSVEKLLKCGKIVRKREAGYVRLFPPYLKEFDLIVYSQLRNESSKFVLLSLLRSGPLTNKQISQATDLAKSTVSERIQKLVALGLVRMIICEDLKHRFALVPGLDISRMISEAKQVPYSATNRFIDSWDF